MFVKQINLGIPGTIYPETTGTLSSETGGTLCPK